MLRCMGQELARRVGDVTVASPTNATIWPGRECPVARSRSSSAYWVQRPIPPMGAGARSIYRLMSAVSAQRRSRPLVRLAAYEKGPDRNVVLGRVPPL